MLRILWNSKSAMMAQQEKLDTISNNIANINTNGYKKEEVSFQDLVSESFDRIGTPANKNNQVYTGTGVKSTEWIRDFTQGDLINTGLNTDLAIDGQGFFSVTMPDGTQAYTRDGSFSIDSKGELVNGNGARLNIDYTANNVVLTKDNFTVDESGNIYIKDGLNATKAGKINLYTVTGQDSMLSVGENLFVPKQGVQVNAANNACIWQGYTEKSNVDIGTEMTDMILAQRAFELGSKGITTADEMWSMVNNMKSR